MKLDDATILNNISYLYKYSESVYGNNIQTVPQEDIMLLEQTYTSLPGISRMNKGCSDCIKYALLTCYSYYERVSQRRNDNINIIIENKDESL